MTEINSALTGANENQNDGETLSTETLWTMEQVAFRLGVSPATIRGLRYRDEFIDPIFIGRQMRWDPADVDAYKAELKAKQRAKRTAA